MLVNYLVKKPSTRKAFLPSDNLVLSVKLKRVTHTQHLATSNKLTSTKNN